jgi:hypothetical protein
MNSFTEIGLINKKVNLNNMMKTSKNY